VFRTVLRFVSRPRGYMKLAAALTLALMQFEVGRIAATPVRGAGPAEKELRCQVRPEPSKSSATLTSSKNISDHVPVDLSRYPVREARLMLLGAGA